MSDHLDTYAHAACAFSFFKHDRGHVLVQKEKKNKPKLSCLKTNSSCVFQTSFFNHYSGLETQKEAFRINLP